MKKWYTQPSPSVNMTPVPGVYWKFPKCGIQVVNMQFLFAAFICLVQIFHDSPYIANGRVPNVCLFVPRSIRFWAFLVNYYFCHSYYTELTEKNWTKCLVTTLVVCQLLFCFCLTHPMLCDYDIKEQGLLLLCISKWLRRKTIEWKFPHFIRAGYKVNEVANLVGVPRTTV